MRSLPTLAQLAFRLLTILLNSSDAKVHIVSLIFISWQQQCLNFPVFLLYQCKARRSSLLMGSQLEMQPNRNDIAHDADCGCSCDGKNLFCISWEDERYQKCADDNAGGFCYVSLPLKRCIFTSNKTVQCIPQGYLQTSFRLIDIIQAYCAIYADWLSVCNCIGCLLVHM